MEKKAPLEDPLPNGFETRTVCEIISVTSKLHLRPRRSHLTNTTCQEDGGTCPHRNFICFVHRIEDYGSKGKHQNQDDKQ